MNEGINQQKMKHNLSRIVYGPISMDISYKQLVGVILTTGGSDYILELGVA